MSSGLTKFGNIAATGLPITAGGISLYKHDYEGFFELLEGVVYTSIATHALKYTVNETRPDGSADNSFPSGHTSSAAQAAAYLQFQYGWEYGVPAYIVTGVVGYSRVEADRHYWRDVVAGAALGTGIQYLVSEMGYSLTKVIMAPYVNKNTIGLNVQIPF